MLDLPCGKARAAQEFLQKASELGALPAFHIPPDPKPTRPGACAPPVVNHETVGPSTVHVAWSECSHDGGDAISRYVVEMAEVEPLFPKSLDFDEIYSGTGVWAVTLENLEPDTEYVFRVSARNCVGASEFMGATHVGTLPVPELIPAQLGMPNSWRELRYHTEVDKLLERLAKAHRLPKDDQWEEFEELLEVHAGAIHRLMRFYSLLGSEEPSPSSHFISRKQFRAWCRDCNVDVLPERFQPNVLTRGEIDAVFDIANKDAEHHPSDDDSDDDDETSKQKRQKRREVELERERRERSGAPANDPDRLFEFEVVHALARLAVLRAERKGAPEGLMGWPGSKAADGGPFESFFARSFDCLMHDCLLPHGDFPLHDELTPIFDSRGVRAVLRKHEPSLRKQFSRWAAVDRGSDDSDDAMTLHELLVSLQEANITDGDKVTMKFLTRCFVKVNAADHAHEAAYDRKGKGCTDASALEFDEWCELICRVCDAKTGGATAEAASGATGASGGTEKVPSSASAAVVTTVYYGQESAGVDQSAPRDGGVEGGGSDENAPLSFHRMLDVWLSLVFIPALRNAATDRVPPAPEDLAARNRLRRSGGGGVPPLNLPAPADLGPGVRKKAPPRRKMRVILDDGLDHAAGGDGFEEEEETYHWAGLQG